VTAGATADVDVDAPVVALRGVGKSWSDVPLFAGFDLDVRPATFTVLVGPSGSGKTTVLTILAEWTKPDAGTVEWRDGFTAEERARWRHVAVLPQTIGLLPELSLLENVALALRLDGVETDGAVAEAMAMLDVLALGPLAGRLATEVSLGQQQRAALARAAVMKPDLLLADEPTSHQDPQTARLVMGLFRQLTETGTACVVASHDPAVHAAGDTIVFVQKPVASGGFLPKQGLP
jgi:putative ABC transport system ATP-binding protein